MNQTSTDRMELECALSVAHLRLQIPYITILFDAVENAPRVTLAQLDRLVDELGFEEQVAQQFALTPRWPSENVTGQAQVETSKRSYAGKVCREDGASELSQFVYMARFRAGKDALDDLVLAAGLALHG